MKLVIMCGGSGTRLWPISRTSSPKQFVKLFDNKSLFELTIERNKELVEGFIIVVNDKQLDICKSQIPAELLPKTQFIIEPIGRNTAPAISLAASLAPKEDLLIVASDHLIDDLDVYNECVKQAQSFAAENLVTFGIKPEYPETGYGYIEHYNYDVVSFKEKPDFKTAQQYMEAGHYLWNSGMFLINSAVLEQELSKHFPEIWQQSSAALKNTTAKKQCYYIAEADMMKIPKESIDYALMEKSENVKVIPSHFAWSDLGSFDSLDEHLPKDENGNTLNKNTYHLNSKNNFILNSKRVVATFDIEDLIIVETEDAVVVGKKGESQKVKELLTQIKKDNSTLLD